MKVAVKAWPESREAVRVGGCPQYGSASLDSTESSPRDGTFRVKIDPERNSTFTITYCADDYYPRVDTGIRSRSEQVIPDPVRIRRKKTDKINNQIEDQREKALVEREIISALNDLAYLQDIDPERFNKVVEQLGLIGRDDGLLAVLKAWRSQR
jgi:hypothetical protein